MTVTVNPVNDAPVAVNNAYSVAEDGSLTVGQVEPNRPLGVLFNDTDAENDLLTAAVVSGPTNGTLTLNVDGSFTYVPRANFSGTDQFYYRASDGQLQSGAAVVTVNVIAVNDAPTGNPDTVAAIEDTTLNIIQSTLLGNDTDVDGTVVAIGDFTQPANGTLTRAVTFAGLIYRPNANFNGTDTFTYRPRDNNQAQGNVVTVTINVAAVNDAPVAVGESYTATEDVALNVPAAGVLANDTDAEGNALTAVLVAGPANGTLSLGTNGGFTYTPRANYSGTDTFTYRPSDGQAQGNTVTVTLTVTAVNDAPVAVADSYTVAEDGALTVAAGGATSLDQQNLRNDTRFNNAQNLTEWQQGVRAGSAGTLASFDVYVVGAPGSVFDVFVNKGAPRQSDDPEFVTQLVVTQAVINQGWVTFDVSAANIQLAAGEWFTIGTRNGYGDSAYLAGSDDTLGGDAYPGSRLWRNFSPVVSVGGLGFDLMFRTRMRAPSGVLANDTDVEGGALSAVLVSGPAHGTLSLAANGGFTYTPEANYSGPDSFTYKANDGTLDSNVATVSLTVIPVNDAPVGTVDAFTTAEDTPVSGNVLANDTDAEGNALTASAVGALPVGLTLNTDGTFTYTPPANFNGIVSFQYKPNDGAANGNVTTVTLTVSAVNDAPVGMADAYTVNEDTAVGGNVLANDTDADNDPLTAAVVAGPANGTLSLGADGGFTYTPRANFSGTDTFTYRPFDGQLYGDPVTVAVVVLPVNDPPAAVNDVAITDEDTAVAVAVLANDTDVEGDALSITAATNGANGAVTFTATGVVYTPAANWSGTDTFTYTISDGNGGTATGSVSLTVTPVNDAPTLAAVINLMIAEDAGAQTVSLAGITAGPNESQTLTVTAESNNPGLIPHPTVAYTSPTSTGTLSFAPVANASGTATITVTVSDGALTTARQFTVTVTPVNDAPTTTGLSPVALLEDAATTNVTLTGGFADIEDGASGLTYAVVGNTNAGLFSAVTVTGGVLRLTPAANASGPATLTVRATDAGGLTVQTTLAVTVAPVNDAPSFAAGANQAVAAGAGAQSVAGWATGISRGPADEANQVLTFVVTTDRPDLFVSPPAIDPATGALTYVPESGATGTATVTVSLKDSGGTANGGIDTSVVRTFTITVNSNGLPSAPASGW